MFIDANKPFIHRSIALRLLFVTIISLTLIATPVISSSNSDKNISNGTPKESGQTSSAGCTVNITKPAIGIGYLFDEFEFPLFLITLPMIFGGITCKAELTIIDEEPEYLLWKFANFKGDEFWSFPIDYEPGEIRYEYYMGKPNFGQFKVWIYCYDIYSQVLCVDTISCLKLF
jgi:hypothetical protein